MTAQKILVKLHVWILSSEIEPDIDVWFGPSVHLCIFHKYLRWTLIKLPILANEYATLFLYNLKCVLSS